MKNIFFVFLIIVLSSKQSFSQNIHKLNQLSKKGASIYVISEIPDSIVDFPFTKEFSKYFNQDGYWNTTNKINEADLILCFRGYTVEQGIEQGFGILFNSYATVFDNNMNFLYRTKGYTVCGGWKYVTEQHYCRNFCKEIIQDVKCAKKQNKEKNKDVRKENFELHYLNGINALYNNKYKESIKELLKCIEYDPGQWQLYKIIGVSCAQIEDYKSAIKYLDRYIEYNPTDYDLDVLYGTYLGLKVQKKIAKSLRACQIMSLGLITLNNVSKVYRTAANMPVYNVQHINTNNLILSNSNQQYSSNLIKQECSSCRGTGYNLSKERPPFYSYNDDPKAGSCNICGDKSIHYHKSCPLCMGKGYVLRHK